MALENYVLQAIDLTKEYSGGGVSLPILRGVNLSVQQGEILTIVGPSGSGKSTLLGLLGGLDTPTAGRIILDGLDITDLPENRLARIRNEKIGFVFQFFYLVPTLSAVENIALPMQLNRNGMYHRDHMARARELIALVGLEKRQHHRPHQLSGGEQQRVALARALINGPRIILADEPTGNLDSDTRVRVLELMLLIHQQMGMTFVIATHDPSLAAQASRVLRLDNGKLAETSSDRKVLLGPTGAV